MRSPALSMITEALLDTYGLYHLAQLQADPALTDRTESFRRAQERAAARKQEQRRAQRWRR